MEGCKTGKITVIASELVIVKLGDVVCVIQGAKRVDKATPKSDSEKQWRERCLQVRKTKKEKYFCDKA